MKELPIGISDFKEIIEDNYYYVDKTLFIKEILKTGKKVTLVPRPRRFGKTLNLSMLAYFFAKSDDSNRHLFAKTAIWHEEQIMAKQGQYPVIFLTFKSVKALDWPDSYEMLKNIIAEEFKRHRYLIANELPSDVKEQYQSILEKKADKATLSRSLLFLTELLCNHHKKRVMVFIDEYDMPITASYTRNFYVPMIDFMRSLLEAVLKAAPEIYYL